MIHSTVDIVGVTINFYFHKNFYIIVYFEMNHKKTKLVNTNQPFETKSFIKNES